MNPLLARIAHRWALAWQAAERHALGELRGPAALYFEAHYFACPECARDMEALEMLRMCVRRIGR